MSNNQQTLTGLPANRSLHDRLNEKLADGTFRGSQLKIAKAIVENWSRAAWGPAARICDAAGVDKALVSNFWERLGYQNFGEFQTAARRVNGSAERPAFTRSLSFDLMKAIHLDHVATLRGIVSLDDDELYHLADQIQFSGRELAGCSKIVIVAATEVAQHYTSPVAHIFSSVVKQPVVVMHDPAKLTEWHKNDGVLVLNICCDPGGTIDKVPKNYHGRCFHLLAGPMNIEEDSHHRILRCHHGTDLFPNVAIVFQVASLIARAAGEVQSRK